MKTTKDSLLNSVRLIYASLIILILTACSPQGQSEPESPSFTPQSIPAATETPIPTPTSPPQDGTPQTGQYIQDEYCSRKFDYHKTNFGELSIAIADNLVEPLDYQGLIEKVLARYNALSANTLVPFERSITVFIISNPLLGECSSKDQLVFVGPEALDTISFNADLMGAGTGLEEYWVRSGLASLALDRQPDDETLRSWYQNTDDLDITGLFIARFLEDWTTEEERGIARMSAASLVQYALEEENIQPELLKTEVNNQVRTRWLTSLAVDKSVSYPYDQRFNGFEYSQSSSCALSVEADPIQFCLNNQPDQRYLQESADVEFLIDHVYYDRESLVDFIISEAPSNFHLIIPDETTNFPVPTRHTHDNEITDEQIAKNTWVNHEILHTVNFIPLKSDDTIWLTEGFGDYLLKVLPLYQQNERRCIFAEMSGLLHEAQPGISPETSSCYSLDAEQLQAAKEWYLAQGGELDEDRINLHLYTDAVAFATMYRNATDSRGIPLDELYGNLYPQLDLDWQDGLELSSTQAASFFAWLCDTYSLDLILDIFRNPAAEDLPGGKAYHELKSEWQAYLISKGEGIEIPKENHTP